MAEIKDSFKSSEISERAEREIRKGVCEVCLKGHKEREQGKE